MRIVCHAGEIGGPDSVREAIELLGAERIGHGIAVMRDPAFADYAGDAARGAGSLPDEQSVHGRAGAPSRESSTLPCAIILCRISSSAELP